MVWTYKQTVDTAWTYTSYNEEFGEGADNDWEVAKDEAEADAAVDQNLAYPLVITRGETVAPPLKSAQIRDTLHKLQVANIPTPCNHVCEYYIKVDMVFLGTLEFDAYSCDVRYDPVTPQELWSCFDESASNGSATNTSAFIGRNDLAAALAAATETWCGDPATSSYDGRGWRAKDAGGNSSRVAVIRWNVTNGLEYYW